MCLSLVLEKHLVLVQKVGEIITMPVWIIRSVLKTLVKVVGEIIPFPVWINLFPVFKTGFELIG